MAKEKKDDDGEILQRIRTNIDIGRTADYDDRERAVDDLNFAYVFDAQWPKDVKSQREADGRPCLTINKMPALIDQVTGEQRQNTPQVKVRPVDSGSDPEMAIIFQGLIRNIENVSQADIAYDTALESAVGCGRGFWRIVTEYEDDSFNQEIRIKRIRNAFSVSWDNAATEYDLSDAMWMSVSETISKEIYRHNWPNATETDFDSDDAFERSDWETENEIRIAEYFEKVPKKKQIHQLSTGEIVDAIPTELPEGVEVVKSREVDGWEIIWRKVSGNEVLEGPTVWPGKYIPIIPVWGKEADVEGEVIRRGVIRYAKDPARMYNYWRSEATSAIGKQPNDPILVTGKQIEGYEDEWDDASSSNRHYLPYNDVAGSQKPFRAPPVQPQTGILTEMQVADDDIRATAGLYQASQGDDTKDLSGKAITALQRKGDIGSFAYIDNLSRSITSCARALVDLIPKIYDTTMVKRILGEDGAEKFVQLNYPGEDEEGNPTLINDLSAGKYDVTVTTGPSFVTQRAEAVDSMLRFAEVFPNTAPMISDLIAKNQDWPNGAGDEIETRLRKMLPPGLATPTEDEEQNQEQQQQQAPPPPDPLQVMAVKEAELKNEGLSIDNEKKQFAVKTEASQAEEAQRKAEGAALDNMMKNKELQAPII